MPSRPLLQKKAQAHHVFSILQSRDPHPQTELLYASPYTLLIAVMLSAQATDVGVNKATKILFEKASTPQDMVNLSQDTITECLKSLNYYRTKSKNVLAISHILLERYKGEVPRHRNALESLPGVGRKTANVVLNVAFNAPTLAVDTHIHRTANRLGLCATKTPLETETALLQIIPDSFLLHAHHWLILHGRYTCKARKPLCDLCPLTAHCHFYQKHLKT